MGNSRGHIISQCEASLRRLRTDYIDLYQIHRPQSAIPIDETLRALDITLTLEDAGELDKLFPPGRMISPFYEADFGPHPHR